MHAWSYASIIVRLQDYEAKIVIGGGAGKTRTIDYFDHVQSKATEPCAEAADMRKRLCGAGGGTSVMAAAATAVAP